MSSHLVKATRLVFYGFQRKQAISQMQPKMLKNKASAWVVEAFLCFHSISADFQYKV
jgi:hypothetical protein